MLTRFAVKNYRGFAEKIVWNLSEPSNYSFNQNAVKDSIVKNGIIYGPNGSGKTNLGLAIFDIANHLSHKWKKQDYYLNYSSAFHFYEPVEFEYTFIFGGNELHYNYSKALRINDGQIISLASSNIIKEELLVNGNELLFKDNDTLRLADEFSITETAKQAIKDSANKISLVNYLLGSAPLPENHPLLQLRAFVENMLFFRSLDEREFMGYKEGGTDIEEYIINNNLTEDFAAFLLSASGQDFKFVKPAQGDKFLQCTIGNMNMPFLLIASTGTRNMELQYYWLKEMANASFVFVDEFDAFYHYELSEAICKMLFANDNQVFVTTHNTFLLNNELLRPDCYFILKNNIIKPLCDLTVKELRYGHNLEKLYRGKEFEQ